MNELVIACSIASVIISACTFLKLKDLEIKTNHLERHKFRQELRKKHLYPDSKIRPTLLNYPYVRELPNFISKVDKENILNAISNNIPILVDGEQGATGKTTLVKILRERGAVAYEPWEFVKIELNKPINE